MTDLSRVFRNRSNLFIGFMVLWLGGIIFRLVDLQIVRHEEIKSEVADRNHKKRTIEAPRGEILDANGRTLAISRKEADIILDPSAVEEPAHTAKILAAELKKPARWRRKLTAAIQKKAEAGKLYYKVAGRVSQASCRRLREHKIRGVWFENTQHRVYPNRWTASHVVGFINRAGNKEGIERSYDDYLKGKPGERESMRDGKGRYIGLGDTVTKQPRPGADVQLTLDANIQFFVEDSLRWGITKTGASNISAVVMDPRTGAILAMANMPDFNPNNYGEAKEYERKNRAVTDLYDPGSAFKIITVASALDSGRISIDDFFHSKEGAIRVADKRIRNFKPFGYLSVPRILWHSSNGGVIAVANKMDNTTFHRYIARFGFGKKTGSGLPAESKGILRPVKQWTGVSQAFLAMGHEISVTPLQMLRAASAVANGGKLVTPYIAERAMYSDGREEDLRPQGEPEQVIRPETALQVKAALEGVVTEGTAKGAAIPGVRVFGKTGTAQRGDHRGYSKDKYNSSFVGFFPFEEPRYGMIVVVHDPKGSAYHGGDVAAPIFSEIGRKILQYDHEIMPGRQWVVTPRHPDWDARRDVRPAAEGRMPDLKGLGLRNLLYQAGRLDIKVSIIGSGKVYRQSPEPGAPIPRNRRCEVVLRKEG